MQASRIQAVVSADHQIHIPAPELPIGSRAEVIVLLEAEEERVPLRFADLIGHGTDTVTVEATVAKVRALRQDRREWIRGQRSDMALRDLDYQARSTEDLR